MAFLDFLSANTPQWAGGTFGAPPVTGTYGGNANIPSANFFDPGGANAGQDPSIGAQASSGDLVQALQALSKADFAKQPANTPLGAAKPTEVPAGRPMQRLSLDALVQLLEKQRAQYGAMTGQPVERAQTLGLLGF